MTRTTNPSTLRAMGLTATIVAFMGGAALAAAPTFETVDADGNGAASWSEASAAMPELTEAEFAAADKDGDKALSAEEYAAAFPA